MSDRPSAGRARVSVLSEDPELGADLDEPNRELARRAFVATARVIERGPWQPDPLPDDDRPGHLGYLVLDGLLLRGLDLHGAMCAELIGEGDVIRPWADFGDDILRREIRWVCAQRARLAVLDRSAAAVAGRWPEVIARLFDRSIQRAHGLAFHLAVCGLPRVDHRLLAVLWNLAGRWGRVTAEGIVVPLPLTHDALSRLVSARRPSVTTALGELRRSGFVTPREKGGGWLLSGEPPEELKAIQKLLTDHTAGRPAA